MTDEEWLENYNKEFKEMFNFQKDAKPLKGGIMEFMLANAPEQTGEEE